jgi:hypothetical protein
MWEFYSHGNVNCKETEKKGKRWGEQNANTSEILNEKFYVRLLRYRKTD